MRAQRRRGRSRQTIITIAAVGACIAATTITALPAAALTSTTNTDSSASGLAASVAAQVFPSGTTTAVVAASTPTTVGQAATLSAETGSALFISDSTSDATAVLSRLQKASVQHIALAGGTTPFSGSFLSQLAAAGVTVDSNLSGATPLAFDTALVSAKAPRGSLLRTLGTRLTLQSPRTWLSVAASRSLSSTVPRRMQTWLRSSRTMQLYPSPCTATQAR